MTSSFDEAKALQECSLEPIHIPGSIQSGGCLFALDGGLKNVVFASANTEDYLGLSPLQLFTGASRPPSAKRCCTRFATLLARA